MILDLILFLAALLPAAAAFIGTLAVMDWLERYAEERRVRELNVTLIDLRQRDKDRRKRLWKSSRKVGVK